MEKCKDCKFWDKYNYECDGINIIWPNDKSTEQETYIELSAADDTDLNFAFKTAPDFGCLNFKAREKN